MDNENEAYWMVQKWEAGEDSYSRYDAINQAVLSGASITAEMAELTSHGYTEKDVLSTVKGNIGTWYRDGEITKQQTADMLRKYIGLPNDEITTTLNKWSSKVVTGIAFEDIKEQFMTGKLTQSKAVEMYVRYGGYSKERATDIIAEWKHEKDYPDSEISFSDYRKWEVNGKVRGVSLEVYTDVAKFRDDETSKSVKSQDDVKRYIESISRDNGTRHALWCCFYKESTSPYK